MPTKPADAEKNVVTLAIDTGGTGIKMMALDSNGKPLTERVRVPTPSSGDDGQLSSAEFEKIKARMPAFDRVSVGFPGVIKHGTTFTAVEPGSELGGFSTCRRHWRRLWKKPVRVCNDAAVQGYAAVQGKGVELMLDSGHWTRLRALIPAATCVPAWS
jgi:polyphosphate glucokinase